MMVSKKEFLSDLEAVRKNAGSGTSWSTPLLSVCYRACVCKPLEILFAFRETRRIRSATFYILRIDDIPNISIFLHIESVSSSAVEHIIGTRVSYSVLWTVWHPF